MPETDETETDVTFASLGVPAPLVAVLAQDGIISPFPVQAATLPDALAGRDILGRAQTGSGKTLGFSLPLVTRLAGGQTASGRPRGLVLVPTRELATQVHEVLRPLARAMGLFVTTIYGGVSYGPQVTALRRRTDIIVATPGRLADLINQGECNLADVEVMVIDEADQMADLGFLPIVRRLLESTPAGGQRMLFSATLDAAIDVLVRRFLDNPATHSVNENSSPAEIEHHVLTIDPARKLEVLAALVGGDKRSLVFTRTKHGAERLARQLTELGIPAAELHGNLRQGARARNLAAFSNGIARVMVATDIAARGIHVDGIDLVIHADPPAEHKAYVHRSGRTARGGADGVVVTLQMRSQAREVTAMMRKAGITPQTAAAYDPQADVLREIGGPPGAPGHGLGEGLRAGQAGGPAVRERGRARRPRRLRPGGSGRGGSGRSRDDRPRRDRREFAPRDRDERPARFQRDDRPARFDGDRGFDRGPRPERDRNDRPSSAARPFRGNRDDRNSGRPRPERNDWYPRENRPASGNGPGGEYRRPGAAGGWRPAGAGSANRSAGGYRPVRDSRNGDSGGDNRDGSGRGDRPSAAGRPGAARARSGYSTGRNGAR